MYILHPSIQTISFILAVITFTMGLRRALTLHMDKRLSFNRKIHILLGKISLIMMFTGLLGGAFIAAVVWENPLVTGMHGYVGYSMAPLIVMAMISGVKLEKSGPKPAWLPLFHGTANTLLIVLALYEILSGIGVYRNFF